VEALATGIPKVLAETVGKGLPRPTFFDQALSFTAILHRPTSVAALAAAHPAPALRQSTRELPAALQAVLDALDSGPQSLSDLAVDLKLTESATRSRLDRLRRDNRVAIEGGPGIPTVYKRS
jgi:DNA-directed RNA polymerase specialized sigma24 family protein